MREPYWRDATTQLHAGDPREVLTHLPEGGADCIVTCPPPWTRQRRTAEGGQKPGYGHEASPAQYVAALRRVFTEARRVLADKGTCWIVTGDRYAGDTGWTAPRGRHSRAIRDFALSGLPAAALIGLPWQLAFTLQESGWIIRNAIVWRHRTETEPVTDRLSRAYELIFLAVKQEHYYFNADALRIRPGHAPATAPPRDVSGNTATAPHRPSGAPHDDGKRQASERSSGKPRNGNTVGNCREYFPTANATAKRHRNSVQPASNNPGDVWTLPAPPFWDNLPLELPLQCIAAGCTPGGTVLDPFAAIATTGLAARILGRPYLGIEPRDLLRDLAVQRLSHGTEKTDRASE